MFSLFSGVKESGFLLISGDVREEVRITSLDDFKKESFTYKDEKLSGILLSDVIALATPISENGKIFFVGMDGRVSGIDAGDLEGCYVTYSKDNSWEVVNINHPISANIKLLYEIVLVSDDTTDDFGVRLIDSTKEKYITPGNLLLTEGIAKKEFQGSPEVEGGLRSYVYTSHIYYPVRDYIKVDDDVLIMSYSGEQVIDNKGGYIYRAGNKINYISGSGEVELENICGIMADPPSKSVVDYYDDVVSLVEKGEKVLTIEIDGISYNEYINALGKGYITHINNYNVEKMTTVYKPISNIALASILTGKTPDETGIQARENRELEIDDIFVYLQEKGVDASYVEGYSILVTTSITPILNADLNEDGFTDDEVFASTKIEIESGKEYIYTHFHGVDDVSHEYGPGHNNVLTKIKEIDNYIKQLDAMWDGKIIIISDHGQHEEDGVGVHGIFTQLDLVTPYFTNY